MEFTQDELLAQAKELKRRNFKPGFDKMTAEAAEIWISINGKRLIRDLMACRYRPMPAVGFSVAKVGGGFRRLAKLTAMDTVVQLAILEKLKAPCEAVFSEQSYAYRPERGLSAALQRYCEESMRHSYAAKIDPVACYDNIAFDVLETALRRVIQDEPLIDLILSFARMPVLTDGQLEQREKGLLQGAPLSPLLCNLYFHALDLMLDAEGIPFIRYADDLVVFGKTLSETRERSGMIRDYMTDELHLTIHPQKSELGSPVDLRFLGHRFERDRFGMIALRANDTAQGAYAAWYQGKAVNNKNAVTLLSDGVLRQKDLSLAFETDQTENEIPCATTEAVNIYSSVVFDSGFLKKAMESGIHVNLFDKHGKLLGRFIPNAPLKAPIVTFEQLQAYYQPEKRLYMAKEFVLGALHNLRLNLRYYHKQNPSEPVYNTAIRKTVALEKKIKECGEYEALLLLEAQVHKAYYDCFDTIIKPADMSFAKRTRRPPMNEINALISFGSTVLYNLLAFQINRSPLDIRVGFLHATNARMESLNLDVAELFKPLLVDRTVFSMVNLHGLRKEHFDAEENGAVYLTEDGKRIFLQAFYRRLDAVITEKETHIPYSQVIRQEIQKLVRTFRDGEKYKAFRQVR